MPLIETRADVPVTVDASLCIDGCTLCVDICPLDSLAIHPETGKAYMHVDECWYCGPCAARCPTGAVTVNMPYLLRMSPVATAGRLGSELTINKGGHRRCRYRRWASARC